MSEHDELMMRAKTRIEELEAALSTAVSELESRDAEAQALHLQVARLRRAAADGAGAAAPPRPQVDGPPPGPIIEDVHEWVDTWLCQTVERSPSTTVRWCRRWPEHPEAVLRMGMLHAEYCRAMANPAQVGWGSWLRNSLDVWLPALLGPNGPFSACDPHHHEEPLFLPGTLR